MTISVFAMNGSTNSNSMMVVNLVIILSLKLALDGDGLHAYGIDAFLRERKDGEYLHQEVENTTSHDWQEQKVFYKRTFKLAKYPRPC